MPNIVMPAVHQPATSGNGKIPVDVGAAGKREKADFTSLLTGVKAISSGAAAPASEAATDVRSLAATPGTNKVLQNAAILIPQACNKPNVKTSRSAKKEVLPKMQTARQDATAAQPAAGIAAPAAAVVTASDLTATQPPAAAQTIRQMILGDKTSKPAADFAVQNNQATQSTAAQVTFAQTAPHLAAAPHSADITRQLSLALPANTAKAGANQALHVALTPETLGKISVKIQHSPTGDANVTIIASQPETLEAMKKDVASLNQILTNAGVPEAGRQIDFRSAPVAAPQPGAELGNAANAPMQGNSQGQQTPGQQTPQNGTGFASSLPNAPPAPVQMPAAMAAPNTGSNGSVDMIA